MVALNYDVYGAQGQRNSNSFSRDDYLIKSKGRGSKPIGLINDLNMKIYSVSTGREVGDYAKSNDRGEIYKVSNLGNGDYSGPKGASPMFWGRFDNISASGAFASVEDSGSSD